MADTLQFDFKQDPRTFAAPGMRYNGPGPRAGLAFNCTGGPVHKSPSKDILRVEMLKAMEYPAIQLIYDTYACPTKHVALYGDISALLAQRHGAVGCHVQGRLRDLDYMPSGFALAYEGTTPRDAYGDWEIKDFGEKVTVNQGEVMVEHGQPVHMSRDGLIVIRPPLEDVVQACERRFRIEEHIRERIRQGHPPMDIYEEEGRW